MSVFAQLRGRIGAARLTLEQQVGARHCASSSLQAEALLALIKKSGKELSFDERATLCDMMANVNFAEADAEIVLTSLQKAPKMERRPAQDMTAFMHYLSAPEWTTAGSSADAALQTFLALLVGRLNGVNCSEPTLKRLTACMIAISTENIALVSLPAKTAHLKSVKKAYRRIQRKFKEQPQREPYITLLPANLRDAKALYPTLQIDIDDIVNPSREFMEKVTLLDASFQCRGDGDYALDVATNRATPQYDQSNMMNMMMMNCMQEFQRRLTSENDGLRLEFAGGSRPPKKRCLKNLLDGGYDAAPSSLKRSRTIASDDSDGENVPKPSAPARVDPPSVPLAAPAPLTAAELPPTSLPLAADGPTIEEFVEPAEPEAPAATKPRAASLLDALLDRNKERADAQKLQKKLEKDAEKLANVAAAKPENPKTATKEGKKQVAESIEPAKPPKKASTLHTPMKTPVPKPHKPKKCGVNHERSREQYLVRCADGHSKSFKYGAKGDFPSAKVAGKAALDYFNRP